MTTTARNNSGKLMLAISSHSPRPKALLECAAELARKLGVRWFVVHVKEPPTPHYRAPTTPHPVPAEDLAHAESLGATAIVERGDVTEALSDFARKMQVRYVVMGRSQRRRRPFSWRIPLVDRLQRKLPGAVLVVV